MKMHNELLNQFNNILRDNNDTNKQISYILERKKSDGTIAAKAVAYDTDDPEDLVQLTINENGMLSYSYLPEWDYNIEDYFFDELEQGYEITYMPLSEHYGMWASIDMVKDEIEHIDGLQKYLSYCQKKEITSQTISLLGLKDIDIILLYQEQNNKYKIIAEMNCNNDTIVLGYNKNAVQPYVTWRTTRNRKYGYNSGHYFKEFKAAHKDFKERSHKVMERELFLTRQQNQLKKKILKNVESKKREHTVLLFISRK